VLLVAALTAGCRDDAGPALPAPTAARAVAEAGAVPLFNGGLATRVVTGLRASGLGCRPRSERDACSIDGSRTYTWRGDRRTVTVTSARMVPDVGFGTWVVLVRFVARDRAAVQRAAARAGGRGGFVLVLDAHSVGALQAAAPLDVEWGRITVRDLAKSEAQRLVNTYVTAATGR